MGLCFCWFKMKEKKMMNTKEKMMNTKEKKMMNTKKKMMNSFGSVEQLW